MHRVDVAIIGGGAVGICTAHYLCERGRRVAVIEKGEVGSGSSHGNAGMIVPSHSVPLAEPGVIGQGLKWMLDPESPFYIKLRWDRALWHWLWQFRQACNVEKVRQAMPLLRDLHLESLRLYEELATSGELEFGFAQRGRLLVCNSEKGLEGAVEEGRHMREIGLEMEILDAAGVQEIEPNVSFDCAGGVFYPQDAHLDPARFVRALASCVERRGGEIHTSTEVLDFVREGNAIRSIETTRGAFVADEVVLACGSWAPELGHRLGLELPIQPAKGYSVTISRPEPCPTLPFMLTEAKVAVTPMGATLRFAGTLELAGMDLSINQRRVQALLRAIQDYVPAYDPDHFEGIEIWRGLRPCTPDGLPFWGRAPGCDNLTLAAGHASVGMSLAPASGRLAARLVERENPGLNTSLLRVERFA